MKYEKEELKIKKKLFLLDNVINISYSCKKNGAVYFGFKIKQEG